jgi:hypothetical protein
MGDEPVNPRVRRPIHPRVERRRTLAAALNIPAGLEEAFAKFARPGGLAVLKIISGEVCRHGACTRTIDAIADLASVDPSIVKRALRTAKAERLIEVRQGDRYNTITLSAEWKARLDRHGDAPTSTR